MVNRGHRAIIQDASLQFAGNGAERRAELRADEGERGDCRNRDLCGNQRILDRRYAGFVSDQSRKKSTQRNSPRLNKIHRAQVAMNSLSNG